MVTIIWLILSLVGVCSFSWWPVLVESLVLLILTAVVTLGHPGEWASFFMVTMGGFAVFAALKLFCGLSLSPLWLAAAPVFLGPCYLLPSVSPAAHFRSLHPAPLSPQREHQLIPVPRTESSRWQALSTLLGVRVVGEASVSHLERGSPLSVVFRVSHTSIPHKVCVS